MCVHHKTYDINFTFNRFIFICNMIPVNRYRDHPLSHRIEKMTKIGEKEERKKCKQKNQSKRMALIEFVFGLCVWTIFGSIQIEINAYCHNQRRKCTGFFFLLYLFLSLFWYIYVKNSISCFYFTFSILNFAFFLHFSNKILFWCCAHLSFKTNITAEAKTTATTTTVRTNVYNTWTGTQSKYVDKEEHWMEKFHYFCIWHRFYGTPNYWTNKYYVIQEANDNRRKTKGEMSSNSKITYVWYSFWGWLYRIPILNYNIIRGLMKNWKNYGYLEICEKFAST